MDVTGLASLATGMANAQLQQAVQLAVLKKAMDIEKSGALQLLQAAAGAAVTPNPPHLGNHVDTFA